MNMYFPSVKEELDSGLCTQHVPGCLRPCACFISLKDKDKLVLRANATDLWYWLQAPGH
jgi:hypothetical protein